MTESRVVRVDGSPAAVAVLLDALRETLRGGPGLVPLGPSDAAPPAHLLDEVEPGQVVVSTTGSTGEPKRVLLSAQALLASARATAARLNGCGIIGPAHWVLALPAQHVAGLQVLVRSIVAGTEPAAVDLLAGFDPQAFAAAHTGRPRVASLVPTQLARLLDTAPHALEHLDAVLLGGAATPPGLLDRVGATRVLRTYGMSETAGGCVYDGLALDGVRVRVEGDAAAGADDGAGRIELSGPVLATGYLGDPDATSAAFVDGWFRTSDVGRIEPDGRLRVLGRIDDVIVTGGVNVAPVEIERVFGSLPGVAAVCVVGVPDPVWGARVVAAVVPSDPAAPPDPVNLLAAARPLLQGPRMPKELVIVDELPLRGIGKPDRRALASALADNQG